MQICETAGNPLYTGVSSTHGWILNEVYDLNGVDQRGQVRGPVGERTRAEPTFCGGNGVPSLTCTTVEVAFRMLGIHRK